MFAPIYEGCNCKDGTWQVRRQPVIDFDRDKVEEFLVCEVCNKTVTGAKTQDGIPCMHVLTVEEIRQIQDETNYYDEESDIDQYY